MAFNKDTDWVGFDLDGTLAHYTPGDYVTKGPFIFGDPIPGNVNLAKALIAAGVRCKIMTARYQSGRDNYQNSETGFNVALQIAINDWTKKHIGTELEVTNAKDGYMHVLIDDRAVGTETNSGVLNGGAIERLMALLKTDSIGDEK